MLHPVRGHRHRSADRTADQPRIDRAPRRLVRAAEPGIGRATEHKAARLCERDQVTRLAQPMGQRLFIIEMLARFEHPAPDFMVDQRRGQIHDNIDLRVGEQLVDRHGHPAI